MTHVYPLISRRGTNFTFLFLIFCLPLMASTFTDDDSGGGCCHDYNYWIKFPKDATANCTYPNADDIEIKEGHCDLLAVSKKDQKFIVPGSSTCYKIFRTYSVVNWCEYVDSADPVVVGRDEDCDGHPGDEDIYVIVKTKYGNDPCDKDPYGYGYGYGYGYQSYSHNYQHVWYDRDSDPYNKYPAAGTKDKKCDYESNPKGFWKELKDITSDYKYFRDHCEMASVGYWQYTQVIKVTDTDAPTISYSAPEPFCSYSSDEYNGCPGSVHLSFSIHESCSPQDVTVKAYFDKNSNGSLDYEVTHLLTGTFPYFGLAGTFPLGTHYIKVVADDGCGNTGTTKIPFEVIDCKGPSPICLNGLAIRLMPVIPAADADGDGDTDAGAMTIWASDFIVSSTYDCNGPVQYSVNRVGEPVDKNETGITLTCDDAAVTLVEIHAWDALWNNDFCVTYVQVQRADDLCPPRVEEEADDDVVDEEEEGSYGYGLLAGRIATEYEMPVGGVMVHRMSADTAHQLSNILGDYAFAEAAMHGSYLLEPEANGDWMRGITISDLHLLKKYLMGTAELDSPYKLLAADLDTSRTVTQADLDLLWKLFLHQATELEFTKSWQFVPKDYEFPDATNPWLEEVPRTIVIDDMQTSMPNLNFVAVKMGDLDESIVPGIEARSSQGQFAFQVPDLKLSAGETQRINFTARQLHKIQAYQATLSFDPAQLEVVEATNGLAGVQHFGLQDLADGLIHTAWHRPVDGDQVVDPNAVIFSLLVHARSSVQLGEVLRINARGLKPEAIGNQEEIMDLQLEFQPEMPATSRFEVQQNTPNPFRQSTIIRYHLPEAGAVNVRITDVTGHLLEEIRINGVAGENTLDLNRRSWSSGVLFYTLTAGEYSVTKKMLLVN